MTKLQEHGRQVWGLHTLLDFVCGKSGEKAGLFTCCYIGCLLESEEWVERVMRALLALSEDEMGILPLDLVDCTTYDNVISTKESLSLATMKIFNFIG